MKETVYSVSGKTSPGFVNTWAVRGDGSIVGQFRDSHGDNLSIQREILYSSGLKVHVNDIAGLRSSAMQSHVKLDWLRDPKSRCMKAMTGAEISPTSLFLRKERLGKFNTVVVKLGSLTTWYALDYGCALVKAVNDFGREGRSEQVLVSFVSGEPPQALFRVPAYFEEVPPSRLISACGPRTAAALKEMDARYQTHRPTAAVLKSLDGLMLGQSSALPMP